ncbi:MAG: hypothetical protein ACAI38_14105 [Myxococcota bacterium]
MTISPPCTRSRVTPPPSTEPEVRAKIAQLEANVRTKTPVSDRDIWEVDRAAASAGVDWLAQKKAVVAKAFPLRVDHKIERARAILAKIEATARGTGDFNADLFLELNKVVVAAFRYANATSNRAVALGPVFDLVGEVRASLSKIIVAAERDGRVAHTIHDSRPVGWSTIAREVQDWQTSVTAMHERDQFQGTFETVCARALAAAADGSPLDAIMELRHARATCVLVNYAMDPEREPHFWATQRAVEAALGKSFGFPGTY